MNLGPGVHAQPRPQWLAGQREEIIDPAQPIIDAHHHLWEAPGRLTYLYDDMLRDMAAGHDVHATVFAQCRTHYLPDGPEWLRPLGEIVFAREQAERALAAQSRVEINAAIVGYADLRNTDTLAELLDRQRQAAGGRLKGIRQTAAWHPTLHVAAVGPEDGKLLLEPDFQAGLKQLQDRGLVYESWLVHTQIDEFAEMARAHPGLAIVLDHLGGPLALGPYEGRRDEVFAAWSRSIAGLASCANVRVKLGGFGMHFFGFGFEKGDTPPSSLEVAQRIRPYVEFCVETLGADRCMFESNFPVDKNGFNYHVMWNAYKRVVQELSAGEKDSLFFGTAAKTYGIERRAPVVR